MAPFVKVLTSVTRNRKFVKAGPAASWLWLCGLAYCQDGLTDGFIPTEALPYLGVKNAAQLSAHLVKAGLWHEEEGGWRVNDYLEHNRSAKEINELKEIRTATGSRGGRPRKNQTQNQTVFTPETKPETIPVAVSVAASVDGSGSEDGQAAFMKFQAAYPPHRRKGGRLVQEAFLTALHKAGGSAVLVAALANHQQSAEWRDKPHVIPGMDTWLEGEYWLQRKDPPTTAATKKPWAPLKAS